MSATADLATGIKTKWAATGGITTLNPVARLYSDPADGEPDLPYTTLAIKRNADPEFVHPRTSGTPYMDTRLATFKAYAVTKIAASSLADAISNGFNTEFAVPNAIHTDWSPVGDVEILEEKAKKSGATLHVATLEFTSITQRVLP